MPRTVIISVGTALLTNQGWRRHQPVPDTGTLLAHLRAADLVKASAETHTLYRLPLLADDELHWLYSDTAEGSRCAEVLHAYYSDGNDGNIGNAYRSTLHRIDNLGHRSDRFEQGLRNLALATVDILQHNGVDAVPSDLRSGEFIICATGGFKPEAAYLNIVGLLFRVPVKYLYEGSEHIVTLPLPAIANYTSHDVKAFFEGLRLQEA